MTTFAVVVSSAKASTSGAVKDHYPFDYLATADDGRVVPAGEVDRLRTLPKLAIVSREFLGDVPRTVDGTRTQVGAIDANGLGTLLKPTMTQGSMTSLVPGPWPCRTSSRRRATRCSAGPSTR